MKVFSLWFSMLVVLLSTVLWGFGCGETADNVEASFDCAAVCSRYQECFDSNYNVDNCTDTCEAEARDNDEYQRKVDQCEACSDEQACSESFDCVDECIGIVP